MLLAPNGYCGAPPAAVTSRPVSENVDLLELSAGFNYIRLIHADPENKNLAGFNASAFVNMTSWLSLGGEFMADYGSHTLKPRFGGVTNGLKVDSERDVYVFGPRVTIWQSPRFRFLAEVLAGGVRGQAELKQGGIHRIAEDNAFAAAIGFGADWRISRHFLWRIVQADYLPTNLGDQWQNNIRLSTGLVFTFGSK